MYCLGHHLRLILIPPHSVAAVQCLLDTTECISTGSVDMCSRNSLLCVLQGEADREAVRVTTECCLQEASWNPYYQLLLIHLCQASRSHQVGSAPSGSISAPASPRGSIQCHPACKFVPDGLPYVN